jgi:hypothetical protein
MEYGDVVFGDEHTWESGLAMLDVHLERLAVMLPRLPATFAFIILGGDFWQGQVYVP